MFIPVYLCLLCLDLFTRVYSCSLVFTYVYTEMDKMEKAASSEIDNFDIWEKDQQEALTKKITKKHLSVGSVQIALYIRCNWL